MLTSRPVITIADFERVDMRVGRIVTAEEFPAARKPSYRLSIDFGGLGVRASIAALKDRYRCGDLPGRQVVCVVNLPPRRIAGYPSEVLVLAAVEPSGSLRLLSTTPEAELGSHIA
jgi:tRNA-binding protein